MLRVAVTWSLLSFDLLKGSRQITIETSVMGCLSCSRLFSITARRNATVDFIVFILSEVGIKDTYYQSSFSFEELLIRKHKLFGLVSSKSLTGSSHLEAF